MKFPDLKTKSSFLNFAHRSEVHNLSFRCVSRLNCWKQLWIVTPSCVWTLAQGRRSSQCCSLKSCPIRSGGTSTEMERGRCSWSTLVRRACLSTLDEGYVWALCLVSLGIQLNCEREESLQRCLWRPCQQENCYVLLVTESLSEMSWCCMSAECYSWSILQSVSVTFVFDTLTSEYVIRCLARRRGTLL